LASEDQHNGTEHDQVVPELGHPQLHIAVRVGEDSIAQCRLSRGEQRTRDVARRTGEHHLGEIECADDRGQHHAETASRLGQHLVAVGGRLGEMSVDARNGEPPFETAVVAAHAGFAHIGTAHHVPDFAGRMPGAADDATVDDQSRADAATDPNEHHVELAFSERELSDGGGIYTLGFQPGTILRNNHIHDVSVNAGRAESNGIFMDEGTTGLLVESNYIHDIARSPVRFHQAGRNLLRRNTLRPGENIPPLRFNSTPEENITVESPQ